MDVFGIKLPMKVDMLLNKKKTSHTNSLLVYKETKVFYNIE